MHVERWRRARGLWRIVFGGGGGGEGGWGEKGRWYSYVASGVKLCESRRESGSWEWSWRSERVLEKGNWRDWRKRGMSSLRSLLPSEALAAVYASHGAPSACVKLDAPPSTPVTVLPSEEEEPEAEDTTLRNAEAEQRQAELDDEDDDDSEEDLDDFEADESGGKAKSRTAVASSEGDEEAIAEAESGKVLVKMLYAPINPSDINMIEGRYALLPDKLPYVAGNEGVGKVVGVGRNVNCLKVGDMVIPDRPLLGTWQTHMLVNAKHLRLVPSDICPVTAAAMTVNPTTSLRLLRDFAKLEPGDVVAQNGSTSAVGRGVIELANAMGFRTINIIRDGPNADAQAKELYELGATLVVREGRSRAACKKEGLEGLAKLALNCIGGPQSEEVSSLLANGGVLVTYGGMSKLPVTLATSKFIFKDITCRGFWLTHWTKHCTREQKDEMFDELYHYTRKGFFKPKAEIMPLDLLSIAISMASTKKVMLKLNDDA